MGLELQPHHKGGPFLTLSPCPSCVAQEQIRTPNGVIHSLYWEFEIVAQGLLLCLCDWNGREHGRRAHEAFHCGSLPTRDSTSSSTPVPLLPHHHGQGEAVGS